MIALCIALGALMGLIGAALGRRFLLIDREGARAVGDFHICRERHPAGAICTLEQGHSGDHWGRKTEPPHEMAYWGEGSLPPLDLTPYLRRMTAEEITGKVAARGPLDDFGVCAFCAPVPQEMHPHRPDCLWLAAVEWVRLQVTGQQPSDNDGFVVAPGGSGNEPCSSDQYDGPRAEEG